MIIRKIEERAKHTAMLGFSFTLPDRQGWKFLFMKWWVDIRMACGVKCVKHWPLKWATGEFDLNQPPGQKVYVYDEKDMPVWAVITKSTADILDWAEYLAADQRAINEARGKAVPPYVPPAVLPPVPWHTKK